MATRQPGAWGIDIGQCALKALRLENVNGVVTATAFDYVEHPKILSQPDADPDLLTREALEKFLSRNSLKGDSVAMSVSGQSGLARFVKLPPVEEKKIGDIVRFEAKQQIPFPLEEVVWDFQKIGFGVVTDGFAMETEIGLFAIKRENVLRALQPFHEVGIEVDVVQMAPLALCNYVAYDLLGKGEQAKPGPDERIKAAGGGKGGKKNCVIVLDMGADSSNLVITDGERIIWQRPIAIGGNRFTRDLTKAMKLTFAKAEHLKRNATKSANLKDILLTLRQALNEFVNEVHKSLAFFTNTHTDAHVQYLIGMGGAFRLPGLQKYLQEKLQLEVKKLPKFARLAGDNVIHSPLFNDNVLSLGVVYGLGLQGLKLARLHTNLLPSEIRVERLVRSKKPWAVAAAACLLLGAGASTFFLQMEHQAVASPMIARLIDKSKYGAEAVGADALDKAKQANDEFAAKQRQVEEVKRSIRSAMAGHSERLNWLKLEKFVNDCLPRPDGQNLQGDKQRGYWDKGQAAFNKWLDRQKAARTEGAGGDEEELVELIQVNIEAFNSLYTDDLAGYFGRLKDACKNKDGTVVLDSMPEDDQKNAPVGGGWVVEVRGYTFHQRQRIFVVDTLVENLIVRGKKAIAGDAVSGKVSHVVLYRFKPVVNPVPGKFDLIDKSDLYVLVHGNPPGRAVETVRPPPGPGPGPGPGAQAGLPAAALANKSRENWRPLSKLGKDAFAPRGDETRPALLQGAQGTETVKRERGQFIRTEFIVQFVWKEPTGEEEKGRPGVGPGGPGTPPGPAPLPN